MSTQLMTISELERQRLVMRVREQLHEVEQIFTDIEVWNEMSRARVEEGADPINPDPDGQLAILRDGYRAFLARESAREAARFTESR
jgi:hypothetical protein